MNESSIPEASLESDSANFYWQTQGGKSSVFWWSLNLNGCNLNKAMRECVRACWVTSVLSDFLQPMDRSLTGSSVHGILQARILDWVAMPSSRGSSRPRDRTPVSVSPALSGWLFTIKTTWEAPNRVIIDIKCVLKSFKDNSQRQMKTP